MVAASRDDVLGFDDLSRECDELKKKYETLERENFTTGKELVELWTKAELSNSLQEVVDRYGSPSSLASHIKRLNASLVEGEKHLKKAYEDAAEACCEFKTDQNILQRKKEYHINVLKGL